VQRLVPDAQPHQVLVQLDACGQTLLARLTARAAHQLQLQPGQAVWAQIKAVSLVPTDASPAAA
jgi:molybdate transport system ATP-binding protein